MQQVRPSSSNPGESNVHQGYNLRVCGNCGYDARGLPTEICPECGVNIWDKKHQLRPAPTVLRLALFALLPWICVCASGALILFLSPLSITDGAWLSLSILLLICYQPIAALVISRIVAQSVPRAHRFTTTLRNAPIFFVWVLIVTISFIAAIMFAIGFGYVIYDMVVELSGRR
jgi:hypothetical protein